MSSKNNKISRRQFLAESSEVAGAGTLGLAASPVLLKSNMARAASPDRRIRIGQVGTAHAHARGKMETLRKLKDEFEVVGIVEPNPERRSQVQDRPAYKGLTWMTEEQLLNTKGLQAVAVETSMRDLVSTGTRCVKAGMHIHLDKPAGESLSAFRKLLEEATHRELTVQMGYMFRNNPAFQFCFKAVREGWLGDIFEVHGVISKAISTSRRAGWAEYAGGTMFNLGSHLIDALIAVLGKPQKVTAYVRRTRQHQDNLADNQLAVFEFPKATATIRSAVIEVEGGKRRQFVVCGDQGTVDIRPLEPPRLLLALSRARGKYKEDYQEVRLPRMPGRYDDQLIEFARLIRGEIKSDGTPYTPAHDLVAHEALLLASGLPLD
jgi:predicted dehydrogenase